MGRFARTARYLQNFPRNKFHARPDTTTAGWISIRVCAAAVVTWADIDLVKRNCRTWRSLKLPAPAARPGHVELWGDRKIRAVSTPWHMRTITYKESLQYSGRPF